MKIKMLFAKKLNYLRKGAEYKIQCFEITSKEYFILTTGLFTQEIIELIISTIKWISNGFKAQSSFSFFLNIFQQKEAKAQAPDPSKEGIASLFSSIPFLENRAFWLFLFKVVLNMIIFSFFIGKYGLEFWNSGGAIFWISFAGKSILDLVASSTEKTLPPFSAFLMIVNFLLIWASIFYIFRIDKTFVDSWKLIFFENVEYDPANERYFNGENAFFSWEKVKKIILWIVIFLLISIPAELLINLLYKLITSQDNTTKNQQTLEQLNQGFVFLTAVIMAPIIEEFFMRYSIFSFKKDKTWSWVSVLNSSFIFSLVHLSPSENILQLLPYFISGLAFAVLYKNTKNIWNSIFAHSASNLIAWIFMVVGGTGSGQESTKAADFINMFW